MQHEHWITDDFTKLEGITTFIDMQKIAFAILQRMPQPVVQVCGPISTGGKGSIEANLEVLQRAIEFMKRQGKHVFDQQPFEGPMQSVKKLHPTVGYHTAILSDFYCPLFESGLIKEFWFLPDWQSSTGAKWEHEQAERLGIKISYFPEDWEKGEAKQ